MNIWTSPQPRLVSCALCLCLGLTTTSLWAQGDDGHARSTLSAAAEDAWLEALIEASPHRRALQAAAEAGLSKPSGERPAMSPKQAPPGPPAQAWPAKPIQRCYGFLPYWTLKSASLHWQQLTQIAWFAAEINTSGGFAKTHGWGEAASQAFIAEAHKHGVQVTLTITLFSKTGISKLLSTAKSRAQRVEEITALVLSGGGDGVSIDFEGLAKADQDKMNAFVALLTQTMHTKLPGSDVTVTTPAVDWSGAWDYQYLAEHSDGLFIMGYGLHWKGGDPGPQLPMTKLSPWKHKTLPWVLDDYFKYGKAKNKYRFIMGLPLYGQDWPSSSDQVGAKKTDKAKAVVLKEAAKLAPTHGGWRYDPASKSAWYAYQIGGSWHQAWVETPDTFALRTAYLKERDVPMGLWALGYADTMPKIWQAIADYQDVGGQVGPGDDAGSGAPDAGASSPDASTPDASTPDASTPDAIDPETTAPDISTEEIVTGDPDNDTTGSDASSANPQDSATGDLTHSRPDSNLTIPPQPLAPAPSSGCSSAPSTPAPESAFGLLSLLALSLLLRRRAH